MTDRSHEISEDDLRSLVRCLSLHIRPLGICSRFADRRLSVFVIEGALPPVLPHEYRAAAVCNCLKCL